MNRHLTVTVPREKWDLLQAVIRYASTYCGECSWLGIGEYDEEAQTLFIEDIRYPKQTNSQAESEIDDEAMVELGQELIKEGKRIVWNGHSHHKMATFFSSADEKVWDNWTSDAASDFFLMSIHNLKQEVTSRIQIQGLDIDLADSPFEIEENPELEEIKKCLQKPKITTYSPKTGLTNYYGAGNTSRRHPYRSSAWDMGLWEEEWDTVSPEQDTASTPSTPTSGAAGTPLTISNQAGKAKTK